jgi:hypothetical protein
LTPVFHHRGASTGGQNVAAGVTWTTLAFVNNA